MSHLVRWMLWFLSGARRHTAAWDELGTTILFITHDIEEAIYLSDRILVLSRRPTEIIEELRIDFPRPRHQLATSRRRTLHGN